MPCGKFNPNSEVKRPDENDFRISDFRPNHTRKRGRVQTSREGKWKPGALRAPGGIESGTARRPSLPEKRNRHHGILLPSEGGTGSVPSHFLVVCTRLQILSGRCVEPGGMPRAQGPDQPAKDVGGFCERWSEGGCLGKDKGTNLYGQIEFCCEDAVFV
jgi:hypothetical protein